MNLRPVEPRDAAALAAIYGHHVEHGLGTFETAPPSAQEMAKRAAAVTARGLPYLVAEIDGKVAGFAYAGPFRLRAAYRYTVEDSVYIAPDYMGRGLGKALLGSLIDLCEGLGLRQMLAMIGSSDNAGSIGVHRSCGFTHVGVLSGVGFKAHDWVDVVVMQRALNGGGARPPSGRGLDLSGD
jgi:phosphinothricin acetyltransferase